jgi:hypothetical protein
MVMMAMRQIGHFAANCSQPAGRLSRKEAVIKQQSAVST